MTYCVGSEVIVIIFQMPFHADGGDIGLKDAADRTLARRGYQPVCSCGSQERISSPPLIHRKSIIPPSVGVVRRTHVWRSDTALVMRVTKPHMEFRLALIAASRQSWMSGDRFGAWPSTAIPCRSSIAPVKSANSFRTSVMPQPAFRIKSYIRSPEIPHTVKQLRWPLDPPPLVPASVRLLRGLLAHAPYSGLEL